MQDSKPFTAQTFIKAATEEMQKRTPHPVEQVEAIMRKIESSPVLTEIEKEILFSHIQDGSQYAAPLPLSIAKDDDGHFCIAIDGRKWKIMRHGIIGNGAADREDFHQAASELVDDALPFSDSGLERVVLSSDLLSLADDARAYRSAMNYRASVWKSLGEVMYDAYCQSLPSSDAKQPTWAELVTRYAWDNAANAVYLSVGLDPADINRELQIVAARKRMQLLRSVYVSSSNIGTVAAEIAAIAGPTPQT